MLTPFLRRLETFCRAAVGTLVLLASVPSAAESVALRVGVQPSSPPFSYIGQDGSLLGFDIEIAAALCAKVSARCEFVQSSFKDLIPGLQSDRFDMVVASLSITEARKQQVDFTDKYYDSPARFVAAEGTSIEISNAGLSGKTIGVKRTTTFDNYVTVNFADVADIRRYGSQDEAIADLVLKRLDVLLGDSIVLQENFLNASIGAGYRFVGAPLSDPRWFGYGIGVAAPKGKTALVSALNQALQVILNDGTYDEIRARYFDYDIYGPRTIASTQRPPITEGPKTIVER